jgi:hypothetical protein
LARRSPSGWLPVSPDPTGRRRPINDSEEIPSYSIERLRGFSTRIFRHSGATEADAWPAAEVLVTSDRKGIDSHGIPLVRAAVEDQCEISKQTGIPFD